MGGAFSRLFQRSTSESTDKPKSRPLLSFGSFRRQRNLESDTGSHAARSNTLPSRMQKHNEDIEGQFVTGECSIEQPIESKTLTVQLSTVRDEDIESGESEIVPDTQGTVTACKECVVSRNDSVTIDENVTQQSLVDMDKTKLPATGDEQELESFSPENQETLSEHEAVEFDKTETENETGFVCLDQSLTESYPLASNQHNSNSFQCEMLEQTHTNIMDDVHIVNQRSKVCNEDIQAEDDDGFERIPINVIQTEPHGSELVTYNTQALEEKSPAATAKDVVESDLKLDSSHWEEPEVFPATNDEANQIIGIESIYFSEDKEELSQANLLAYDPEANHTSPLTQVHDSFTDSLPVNITESSVIKVDEYNEQHSSSLNVDIICDSATINYATNAVVDIDNSKDSVHEFDGPNFQQSASIICTGDESLGNVPSTLNECGMDNVVARDSLNIFNSEYGNRVEREIEEFTEHSPTSYTVYEEVEKEISLDVSECVGIELEETDESDSPKIETHIEKVDTFENVNYQPRETDLIETEGTGGNIHTEIQNENETEIIHPKSVQIDHEAYAEQKETLTTEEILMLQLNESVIIKTPENSFAGEEERSPQTNLCGLMESEHSNEKSDNYGWQEIRLNEYENVASTEHVPVESASSLICGSVDVEITDEVVEHTVKQEQTRQEEDEQCGVLENISKSDNYDENGHGREEQDFGVDENTNRIFDKQTDNSDLNKYNAEFVTSVDTTNTIIDNNQGENVGYFNLDFHDSGRNSGDYRVRDDRENEELYYQEKPVALADTAITEPTQSMVDVFQTEQVSSEEHLDAPNVSSDSKNDDLANIELQYVDPMLTLDEDKQPDENRNASVLDAEWVHSQVESIQFLDKSQEYNTNERDFIDDNTCSMSHTAAISSQHENADILVDNTVTEPGESELCLNHSLLKAIPHVTNEFDDRQDSYDHSFFFNQINDEETKESAKQMVDTEHIPFENVDEVIFATDLDQSNSNCEPNDSGKYLDQTLSDLSLIDTSESTPEVGVDRVIVSYMESDSCDVKEIADPFSKNSESLTADHVNQDHKIELNMQHENADIFVDNTVTEPVEPEFCLNHSLVKAIPQVTNEFDDRKDPYDHSFFFNQINDEQTKESAQQLVDTEHISFKNVDEVISATDPDQMHSYCEPNESGRYLDQTVLDLSLIDSFESKSVVGVNKVLIPQMENSLEGAKEIADTFSKNSELLTTDQINQDHRICPDVRLDKDSLYQTHIYSESPEERSMPHDDMVEKMFAVTHAEDSNETSHISPQTDATDILVDWKKNGLDFASTDIFQENNAITSASDKHYFVRDNDPSDSDVLPSSKSIDHESPVNVSIPLNQKSIQSTCSISFDFESDNHIEDSTKIDESAMRNRSDDI